MRLGWLRIAHNLSQVMLTVRSSYCSELSMVAKAAGKTVAAAARSMLLEVRIVHRGRLLEGFKKVHETEGKRVVGCVERQGVVENREKQQSEVG